MMRRIENLDMETLRATARGNGVSWLSRAEAQRELDRRWRVQEQRERQRIEANQIPGQRQQRDLLLGAAIVLGGVILLGEVL